MKFKIDENLPVEVKELLNEAGYDALLVVDQQLGEHRTILSAKFAWKKNVSLLR